MVLKVLEILTFVFTSVNMPTRAILPRLKTLCFRLNLAVCVSRLCGGGGGGGKGGTVGPTHFPQCRFSHCPHNSCLYIRVVLKNENLKMPFLNP